MNPVSCVHLRTEADQIFAIIKLVIVDNNNYIMRTRHVLWGSFFTQSSNEILWIYFCWRIPIVVFFIDYFQQKECFKSCIMFVDGKIQYTNKYLKPTTVPYKLAIRVVAWSVRKISNRLLVKWQFATAQQFSTKLVGYEKYCRYKMH